VLVASGLVFYAYYAGDFVALLVVEALAVYALTRGSAKWWKAAAAIALTVLIAFKYSGFIYANLARALPLPSQNPFLMLTMPLAISFFTFEFLHYAIDRVHGKIQPAPVGNFLAFAFFFPSLSAGPIKRFQEFDAQVRSPSGKPASDFLAGGLRIIVGLFKKLVIAESLGYISSAISSPAYVQHSPAGLLWLTLVAFTLKIYFDFSGYSDIAIGSALLFGLRIPENFDYPLLSRNLAQFWRKWHMSLYSWLNDYLFTPLSVNLRHLREAGLIISFLAVFSISGLWHGANWNFVAWGAYHGIGVASYFAYTRTLKRWVSRQAWYSTPYFNAAAVLFNFLVVTVSFALFAAPLDTAMLLIAKILFIA